MTDPDLLALLRDCYTPHTQQNIVAAGLVRSATLTPDPDSPGAAFRPRLHAHITLHAPTADEAATAQLSAQIENRLLGLDPIARVTITLIPTLFPIL
jgi:metal-sulfur cluster biosynthetic enzyme